MQSAGAVSFAMIVKAAEPAFAALIGTLLYGKKLSQAKWLCLIPVIGGVILASVKELDFAWSALITASCVLPQTAPAYSSPSPPPPRAARGLRTTVLDESTRGAEGREGERET